MQSETKAYLIILLAGTGWGCTGLFLKLIAQFGFSSIHVASFRMGSAALFALIAVYFFDRKALRIDIKDVFYFLGSGFCSVALFNILYFQSILLGSLSVAAVLLATTPIFALILAAIFLKERLNIIKVIAICLTVTGCVLVTGGFASSVASINPFAIICGLGAALSYSLYSIIGRKLVAKYPPLTISLYSFIFSSLALIPLALLSDAGGATFSIQIIFLIAGLGLFSTSLPYILYTFALRRVEAGKAAVAATFEPIVAASIGIIFFHDDISLSKLIGMLLVIGSILLLAIKGSSALPKEVQSSITR